MRGRNKEDRTVKSKGREGYGGRWKRWGWGARGAVWRARRRNSKRGGRQYRGGEEGNRGTAHPQ